LTVVRWWKELTDILGEPVIVHEGNGCFEGLALDLALDEALLVQLSRGMMRGLLSEDITIRRSK
jgi:biotin-(acetyl-CoA carboxylase) ligase